MTIAFLDHHLDNWHAKVFLNLLRERGHTVVGYETDPLPGDWCADNGVPRAQTPDEAIENADAIMLLAPDNIEAHLDLFLPVMASGKPIWIDKQLAPTVDDSLRIIQMAQYHSTPLTCASSLRHAAELEEAFARMDGPAEEGIFSGYGDWNRYGVHTIAMALRSLRTRVAKIESNSTQAVKNVALEFTDGRRASLQVVAGQNASAAFPWRFALRRGNEYEHGAVSRFDEFYIRQLETILQDFENRHTMDPSEMVDTVRILEVVAASPQNHWHLTEPA